MFSLIRLINPFISTKVLSHSRYYSMESPPALALKNWLNLGPAMLGSHHLPLIQQPLYSHLQSTYNKSSLLNTKINEKKRSSLKPVCFKTYLAHLQAKNRSPTSAVHRGILYEYACLEALRGLDNTYNGFHELHVRGGPGDQGVDLSGLWVNPSVAQANPTFNTNSDNNAVTTTTNISDITAQHIRASALNVLVQCKNLSTQISSATIRELVGTYILAVTSASSKIFTKPLLQVFHNYPAISTVANSNKAVNTRAATLMTVVPTTALPTIMLLMSHTGLSCQAEAVLRHTVVPLIFLRVPRPEFVLKAATIIKPSSVFDPRAYRLAGGATETIINDAAKQLLKASGTNLSNVTTMFKQKFL